MAGRPKLAPSQIADNSAHERAWNLGENKEDGEGVPFIPLTCTGDASWWSNFFIAGGQKLAMSQITDDLGHERI